MDLIPLSASTKAKTDLVAIPGTLSMPFFTDIPWVQIAAFVAAVYSALRILEFLAYMICRFVKWWKGDDK